jgi:hypothetical protein
MKGGQIGRKIAFQMDAYIVGICTAWQSEIVFEPCNYEDYDMFVLENNSTSATGVFNEAKV